MSSETKDSKLEMTKEELQNEFIKNFDLYRDATVWGNFMGDSFNNFCDSGGKKSSATTKIQSFHKIHEKLSFDITSRIETMVLTELVKSMTVEELTGWHNALAQCRTPEVIERINKMHQSMKENLCPDLSMVCPKYLSLVNELGQLCAEKCSSSLASVSK